MSSWFLYCVKVNIENGSIKVETFVIINYLFFNNLALRLCLIRSSIFIILVIVSSFPIPLFLPCISEVRWFSLSWDRGSVDGIGIPIHQCPLWHYSPLFCLATLLFPRSPNAQLFSIPPNTHISHFHNLDHSHSAFLARLILPGNSYIYL